MLTNFKALPIILAAALLVFWLAELAFPDASRGGELRRMRWAFLLSTTAAFVSPSIWVYVGILTVLMAAYMLPPGEKLQRAAVLWATLVLAVPNVGVYLPGFGGIANLFEMTHVRALTLGLLLPVVAAMQFGGRCPKPLGLPTDWFVAGYFALQVFIDAPQVTITVLLREVLVLLTDTVLPYWVFSRASTSAAGFMSTARAFVLTMLVMAMLAMFESVKHWPLYDAITTAWGLSWDMTIFLDRGGFLRAKASAGFSLALGFVLVVALGLWVVVRREVTQRSLVLLGDLVFVGGLLAALARGAWVGALVLVVLIMLTSKGLVWRLALAVIGCVALVLAAPFVPALQSFMDLLPFVGRVESENVVYRQRLIEISLSLIAQSPLFGVPGYLRYMEELRQGQGIIDIVNTYIAVALNTGLVGLSLFVGIFVSTMWRLLRLRIRVGPRDEAGRVSVCLIATTVAAMLVLATTSTIIVVLPTTYMLIGMGVSWARLHQGERVAKGSHVRMWSLR